MECPQQHPGKEALPGVCHVCLATRLCLTLVTPWTVPARLLCPWDSPGKSTGVGCHFLLQGIFPTQESNPGLLYCMQTLYRLSYGGKPQRCLQNLNHSSRASCKPESLKLKSEVAQLYLTLCDPMDCNLPGSSVHGILQARVLEWVAISFSRGSS